MELRGDGILPAYIAGPVIDTASEVEIQLGKGQVLRVPTFGGAASLGHVRFYAIQVPASHSKLTLPAMVLHLFRCTYLDGEARPRERSLTLAGSGLTKLFGW